MFPAIETTHWLTVHGLFTIIAVLVYVVTAHVLQQRRHPTAAIAWVLFILLAPYAALPAFLLFGSRKQARPRGGGAVTEPGSSVHTPWAVQTALALGQPAPASYADLRVHADGAAALEGLWRTLDGAVASIDVCSFIIGRDALGSAVVQRLADRARAGVRVRLMLDGLGQWMGGHPDLEPLRAAGAELTLFVPPLHSPLKGRSNLRDHRKMVIADAGRPGARLWCGGRNLATQYFEGDAAQPAWRDLSFDVAGPLVQQAQVLFEHDWNFARGRKPIVLPVPGVAAAALPGGAGGADRPAPSMPGGVSEPAHDGGRAAAQLIASGPDQVDDTLYALLITAAYRARERITLTTPYFVPDAALLLALCMAARRGVVVDLLLPARSNHRLSDVARCRALRALAAAGGRIWLAPQMLHAKLVLIDQSLALAGSANLDGRSLFINYELMVAFHDRAAIGAFTSWFDRERSSAAAHQPSRAGLLRDIGEGLVLWVGFQL
jgi:cardiolipin synthase